MSQQLPKNGRGRQFNKKLALQRGVERLQEYGTQLSGFSKGNKQLLVNIKNQVESKLKLSQVEVDACESIEDLEVLIQAKKNMAKRLVDSICHVANSAMDTGTRGLDKKAEAKMKELDDLF